MINTNSNPECNSNSIYEERVEKLNALKEKKLKPYGGRFDRSSTIKQAMDNFKEGDMVKLAGRLTARRSHGKAGFSDLSDLDGKIQLYIKKDIVGDDQFDTFKQVDIGDILGIEGKLFKTRTGQETVEVTTLTVLAKSLRDLPEKWHGLKDVEIRFRKRYLDLIANPEVRQDFVRRTKIIDAIRNFLNQAEFLEVETPMMHTLAGGAAGNPFQTHQKSLDMDLYLRIAPELYLKRLLVGGYDKVYEINRSFRNEGLSTHHNPEFTMLEVYEAYSDCEGMMKLTEELVSHIIKEVACRPKTEIDFTTPWPRVSFAELVKKKFDIDPSDSDEAWKKKLKAKGHEIPNDLSRSQLEKLVEEALELDKSKKPVFVIDHFTRFCPLAKTRADNPDLSERFELYVGDMEIANAYSELNDPIEQRERLEAQDKKKVDHDFIEALEHGMPPAGGLGIGIDRLVMVLLNKPSIRDVILFPMLRKEQ